MKHITGVSQLTTFTTEDREQATVFKWAKYQNQDEIKFFWPLTEQMELDLEYAPTHIHYKAKGIAGTYAMPIQGSIFEFSEPPKWTTSINIDSNNIVIKSEKVPPLYRRVIFKLLGIHWEKL